MPLSAIIPSQQVASRRHAALSKSSAVTASLSWLHSIFARHGVVVNVILRLTSFCLNPLMIHFKVDFSDLTPCQGPIQRQYYSDPISPLPPLIG